MPTIALRRARLRHAGGARRRRRCGWHPRLTHTSRVGAVRRAGCPPARSAPRAAGPRRRIADRCPRSRAAARRRARALDALKPTSGCTVLMTSCQVAPAPASLKCGASVRASWLHARRTASQLASLVVLPQLGPAQRAHPALEAAPFASCSQAEQAASQRCPRSALRKIANGHVTQLCLSCFPGPAL